MVQKLHTHRVRFTITLEAPPATDVPWEVFEEVSQKVLGVAQRMALHTSLKMHGDSTVETRPAGTRKWLGQEAALRAGVR